MPANCTKGGCEQQICPGCGFDRDEAERRKKLPLVKDGKTGLLRKIVGRHAGADLPDGRK